MGGWEDVLFWDSLPVTISEDSITCRSGAVQSQKANRQKPKAKSQGGTALGDARARDPASTDKRRSEKREARSEKPSEDQAAVAAAPPLGSWRVTRDSARISRPPAEPAPPAWPAARSRQFATAWPAAKDVGDLS